MIWRTDVQVWIFIGGYLLTLVVYCFYLLLLRRILLHVQPQHRKTRPGLVWLNYVPVFNIYWHFHTVYWMSESLAAEFEERGIVVRDKRPGHQMGMNYCGMIVASVIPFLGAFALLAAFIFWILYWVEMSKYNKILKGILPVHISSPDFNSKVSTPAGYRPGSEKS